jgi:hypothetical protein
MTKMTIILFLGVKALVNVTLVVIKHVQLSKCYPSCYKTRTVM